ncbi:hypothetical protein LR48_Vigan01g195900 [Vigna angularis]|uniref:Uncharacterized protein n=1 Tax=Phaseolus angularis TaxID=3914 RepID=A0A0L9TP92_PHAAN|nr:hypothetical protein LR48_Vigan01g195900 [Vigna angularis]
MRRLWRKEQAVAVGSEVRLLIHGGHGGFDEGGGGGEASEANAEGATEEEKRQRQQRLRWRRRKRTTTLRLCKGDERRGDGNRSDSVRWCLCGGEYLGLRRKSTFEVASSQTTNRFRLDGSRLLGWGQIELSWVLVWCIIRRTVEILLQCFLLSTGNFLVPGTFSVAGKPLYCLGSQKPRQNPIVFRLGSQPRQKEIDFLPRLYMPQLRNRCL